MSHPGQEIRYGFQRHLRPEFPSQIIIDVTEFCNLACIHCPHPDFVKSEAFNGRYLDVAVHDRLVDEVAREGRGYCKYLRYTAQGEPLLHPKITDMVTYASRVAGRAAGVAINLTTNGALLTEKKIKELLEAGVNVFDISLDAHTPETYARVRVRGDLVKTRANVLNLIRSIKTGNYPSKLVVSFVEQPLNRGEAEPFETFWKNEGADYVVVRKLHSCAGSKREIAKEMRTSGPQERKPCLYPWERLVLSPSGQVGYCPADWRYRGKVAYLKDSTIKAIWQGEFMRELREAHLKNDFSCHGFCGQCPDWVGTRWPEEGRAYSNMMHELVPEDLLYTGPSS